MFKKRSKALVLLSVFLIGAMMSLFTAIPVGAETPTYTEYVTYEYMVKADTPVCAFEGNISYPSNALGFVSATSYATVVYEDDGAGTVKFNATKYTDSYDFSDSTVIISVTFGLKGTYSPSDIVGTISDIYTADQVLGRDTARNTVPYNYVNAVNGVASSSGYVDLDNPDNSTVDDKLSIYAYSLSLSDNISLVYAVDSSVLEGYENARIDVVDVNGNEFTLTEYSTMGTYRLYNLDATLPQNMGRVYTAVLCAERDGVEYRSGKYNYSILQYCKNKLYNTSTDAKLKTMIVDLLNYGTACQAYKNFDPADYVNSFLTDEMKAYGTQEVPQLNNVANSAYGGALPNAEIQWAGANLVLLNTISIRVYVSKNYNLEGVTNSAKIQNTADPYVLSDPQLESGSDYYYYEFKAFNPASMDRYVDFTLMKNGEAISNTYRYSINSYLANTIPRYEQGSKMRNLLESIAKYGDSAYKYKYNV